MAARWDDVHSTIWDRRRRALDRESLLNGLSLLSLSTSRTITPALSIAIHSFDI
jgi:hypothetical protein